MTAAISELERIFGLASHQALPEFLTHYRESTPSQRANALLACAHTAPDWFTADAIRDTVMACAPDANVLATQMTTEEHKNGIDALFCRILWFAPELTFEAVRALIHTNLDDIHPIVRKHIAARVGTSCTAQTPWCNLAAAVTSRMTSCSNDNANAVARFAASAMKCDHEKKSTVADIVGGRQYWLVKADECARELFEFAFPDTPWLTDAVLTCVENAPIKYWVARLRGRSTADSGTRADERYIFLRNLGEHIAKDFGLSIVRDRSQSAWVIVALACADKLALAPWDVRAPICIDKLPNDMSFLPFDVLRAIVGQVDVLPHQVVGEYTRSVGRLVTRA